jgi:hypothetical protein
MGAAFALDHSELEFHYAHLARKLSAQTTIDSNDSFNRYCQNACRFWREQFPDGIGATSSQFHDLQKQIASANAGVIKTSWGGVVVTLHEHPRVEKFLVVKAGGYLALEKHEQKDEHLEMKAGVLWRSASSAHSRSAHPEKFSPRARPGACLSARKTFSSSSAPPVRKEWIATLS